MIKSTTLLALLLFATVSFAMDPPVKIWEKWYYTSYDAAKFYDIDLTNSLNLFITGTAYDYSPPAYENYVAMLMNLSGDILWEVDYSWYGAGGNSGEVLADGSFIITGGCYVHQDSTYGLFLMKIDQNGSTEWTKVYDYPGTTEEGYGITCLPDGGFAVCGKVHGTGPINAGQCWLLRTDASGDTLWTREWGSTVPNSPDWGKNVLYNNGELCMLALGCDDTLTTYGTHLLFFSPEGEYLRGTTESITTEPASICIASDGGYTFTNSLFPRIWHTDQYGNLLWWKDIYVTPNDDHQGYCIRQTMDSGYVFCGWDGYNEYQPVGDVVDYKEGWLARFDSEGNELWNINNTVSVDHHFYSCLQLPEGGYMACGTWQGSGYLIRYAPETGIAETAPAATMNIDVSPNPFNSTLSVTVHLPESAFAELSVFDISGRIVDTIFESVFPSGDSFVEWTAPENLSTGCYLIRLTAGNEVITRNCILFR